MVFCSVLFYYGYQYLETRRPQLSNTRKQELDEKRRLAREKQLQRYKDTIAEQGAAKSYKEMLVEEERKRKAKKKNTERMSIGIDKKYTDYNPPARRFGQSRMRRGGG